MIYTFLCLSLKAFDPSGMSRGRGRGRGRGKGFGGSHEALGLAHGESAPPPILQPPPLFPTLERKPLELKSSEVEDYLVTIKQELKQYMTQSPFHISVSTDSFKIAKYSDKYKLNGESDKRVNWDIDWNYFPKELKLGSKKVKKKAGKYSPTVVVGSKKERNVDKKRKKNSELGESGDELPKSKRKRKVTFDDDEDEEKDIEKKLKNLEKTEQLSAESEQSAEEEVTEVYDEEEDEEGTDYNLTYFDNGEDFDIGEDDTLEDGPIY